jgi:branched-chain amino acid transport system substrate-binding protein
MNSFKLTCVVMPLISPAAVKNLRCTIFLACFLAMILFCRPVSAKDANITIGVLTPLTGPYALEAKSQRDFAYLAVDEINAKGGVLGRQIEVVVEDTELKAGIGIKKAKKLIDSGVKYLTGGLSSSVVGAISNVAEKSGVLHIGLAGSNSTTGVNCNRNHFNLAAASFQMARGTGTVVLDKVGLKKKWFCITADYNWGHTTLDSVRKTLEKRGGRVVGNVMTVIREQDFSAALVKALVSKADVLCVIVWGTGQSRLLEQAYRFGVRKKMDIVVIISSLNIMVNTSPEALQGVYMGVSWYWNLDNQTTRTLNNKYIARFGHPGDWSGVLVYDSIMVLADVMKKTGSLDVNHIIPALEGWRYQTSKGPALIRTCDHRAMQDWYVGFGKPVGMRKSKWDVMDVIARINGNDILHTCREAGCVMNR